MSFIPDKDLCELYAKHNSHFSKISALTTPELLTSPWRLDATIPILEEWIQDSYNVSLDFTA